MKRSRIILALLSLAAFTFSAGLAYGQYGTVVGWGYNYYSQCDVPAPNADFIAVAGNQESSMCLKSDGSIVAWGVNSFGECEVPEPNVDFVAIAGGFRFSLGLKSDGTIVAWGSNFQGQCDIPAPNEDFEAISAGLQYGMGLKSDGSIVIWGVNNYNQHDIPSPNTDFVAISAGNYHCMGLKSDGSIVAWGRTTAGMCDVPTPNSDFEAIAGGGYHSLGLKSDGTIVGWGDNSQGQCDVAAPNAGFVAISAGQFFSMGLRSNGSIAAWGNNADGYCDVPEPNTGFSAIMSSVYHSLALRGDTPIPTLLSFLTAENDAGGVRVEWSFSCTSNIQDLYLLRQQDNETPTIVASWLADEAKSTESWVDQNVQSDKTYTYSLEVNLNGERFVVGEYEIIVDKGIPNRTRIVAASPNPFNPKSTISYYMSEPGHARLSVFDVSGGFVKTLVDMDLGSGEKSAEWNGTDTTGKRVASGTYFLRLETDQGVRTRKVTLAK